MATMAHASPSPPPSLRSWVGTPADEDSPSTGRLPRPGGGRAPLGSLPHPAPGGELHVSLAFAAAAAAPSGGAPAGPLAVGGPAGPLGPLAMHGVRTAVLRELLRAAAKARPGRGGADGRCAPAGGGAAPRVPSSCAVLSRVLALTSRPPAGLNGVRQHAQPPPLDALDALGPPPALKAGGWGEAGGVAEGEGAHLVAGSAFMRAYDRELQRLCRWAGRGVTRGGG
jgi:hypothetical protein